MITIVVIFIILFIIAAVQGNTEDLASMGKIVLGIALFIIFGLIFTQPILLCAVLVLGGIILLIYFFAKKTENNQGTNSSSTTTKNSNVNTTQNNDGQQKITSTQQKQIQRTEFQKALDRNTKTPAQVQNETTTKEKGEALQKLQAKYAEIKSQLMSLAKSGQYANTQQGRLVTIDYFTGLNSYIAVKYNPDYKPTPTITNMHPLPQKSRTFYPTNKTVYDLYISEIKKLAHDDGITIEVIFKDELKKTLHPLPPCTITRFDLWERYFHLYFRCTIAY